MAIKCVSNPVTIGNVMGKRFLNSTKYPLKSVEELKGYVLDFLVKFEEVGRKNPNEGISPEDFLKSFTNEFNSSLEYITEMETDENRVAVLRDALTVDWLNEVKTNALPYFTSGKVDAQEKVEQDPADTYEEDVAIEEDESVTERILNTNSYGDLLLTLMDITLEEYDSPAIKDLDSSQLASDFDKFLKYEMYSAMLDTRAKGENLGFIQDKKILNEKFKKRIDAINASPLASDFEIESVVPELTEAGFVENISQVNIAKQLLFGEIAGRFGNELLLKLYTNPDFNWNQSFGATNVDSSMYMDSVSRLIFTNSPRFIQKGNREGEYYIDPESPILSESEIKNVVLPKLATVRSHSIDGIRKELAKHKSDPIINSIYVKYFGDISYKVTDTLGNTEEHYPFGYAVEEAIEEEFGEKAIEKPLRKFSGFNNVNSDKFKNRIIHEFISIERSDREYLKDDKVESTVTKSADVQIGYVDVLTENMSNKGSTKPEIAKNLIFKEVYTDSSKSKKDLGTVEIVITEEKDEYVNNVISFKVKLKEHKGIEFTPGILKGHVVKHIIPDSIEFPSISGDTIADKNRAIKKALKMLGFQWTDNPKFLKEYDLAIIGKSGEYSLSNLLGNLAIIAGLNSAGTKQEIEKSFNGTIKSNKELMNLPESEMSFSPAVYMNSFFHKLGPVTRAISNIYNFKSSTQFTTQENTRAASTTAVTPDSRKITTILDAQEAVKKGVHSVLEGNKFVTRQLTIENTSVKEGVEKDGDILLLGDMNEFDRTAAFINVGLSKLAFSDNNNLRTVVLQAHQYADKTSPRTHTVKSNEELITTKDGKIYEDSIINRIVTNNKRKYNNLARSIYNQWYRVLASEFDKTIHFMSPSEEFTNSIPPIKEFNDLGEEMLYSPEESMREHLIDILKNSDNDLTVLNDLLQELNLDPEYISKHNISPEIAYTTEFDVNKYRKLSQKAEDGTLSPSEKTQLDSIKKINIKNTTINFQKVFNDPSLGKSLIKFHHNKFLNKFYSKLGSNVSSVVPDGIIAKLESDLGIKDLSSRDLVSAYHLLHLDMAPQLEELSMGDSSQFAGDFSFGDSLDFSIDKNKFSSKEDFEKNRLFKLLDAGQSVQNAAKSKRASLLLTNGKRLALVEDGKRGLGVGNKFHTAVIEDTVLQKRILTGIKNFENYDGIRIGLDIVRRQINASMGDSALISKGEAHKDGYVEFDHITGTYRTQKMSTMYMTPEFIENSELGYDLIKRMLTAIPFEPGLTVNFPDGSVKENVSNAWDMLMSLENTTGFRLSDPQLWDAFQKTEALNPNVRGKYISYLTFTTAEKTGSTAVDSNNGYGFSNETDKGGEEVDDSFRIGDKVQWTLNDKSHVYEDGVVSKIDGNEITVVQRRSAEEYVFGESQFTVSKIVKDKDGNHHVIKEDGLELQLNHFHKGFNYSTLDYKNHYVVLKAGKDATYKGGVAKMIQGFNSVLFNNSYVKDALNTIQAQGNISKSNIDKLKEDIITRTMSEILKVDSIEGVDASELYRVKKILNSVPDDSAITRSSDRATLAQFLNNEKVQILGLKNFIISQIKADDVDIELYKKMVSGKGFSFSGGNTNLMVKTFSTFIETETIKNRYNGGLMILSPGEDFIKVYDFDGQSLLRKDLLTAMIDENQMFLINPNVSPSLSKEEFIENNFQLSDVIRTNGKLTTIREYMDSNLIVDYNELYDHLKEPTAAIFPISSADIVPRKLKHTEILDDEGNSIKNSEDYNTFVDVQSADSASVLSKNVFNIFKYIADTTDRPDYNFFRQFETYEDYVTYFPKMEYEASYDFINPIAIQNYITHINKNKITVNKKSALSAPIKIILDSSDLQDSEYFDIFTAYPELAPLEEALKENNISIYNEQYPVFEFSYVENPKLSNTRASVQKNVIAKISLSDFVSESHGENVITPLKQAKSNLIKELRSTKNGKAKYSTTDSEMVIPFIYHKEFGFKEGEIPSISKIVGYSTNEDEALENAKIYFDKNTYVNVSKFRLDKVETLSDETTEDRIRRGLLIHRDNILDQLADVQAQSGVLTTEKEVMFNEMLENIDAMLAKEDELLEESLFRFKKSELKIINTASYTKQVKAQRAQSFIDYLQTYYGRIPGTGLQTNGSGKTIGFIQDQGNTAYLDPLNALITGSDFDIDKITMILRAVDDNGIAYEYSEWVDVGAANDIAQEFLNNPEDISIDNIQLNAATISTQEYNDKLREYIQELRKNLYAKNEIATKKLTEGEILFKLSTAKKAYRKRFERGMQNYILDQMRAITKAVDVQFEAQTMVHMDTITQSKNNLLDSSLNITLSPEAKAYKDLSVSSFNLMATMKLETENFAGKKAVGAYANAQKSLALILSYINKLKEIARKEGRSTDDIGKFKKALNLVIERDGELFTRTSNTFVNQEEVNQVSGQEEIVLRKLINDFRSQEGNEDASILDISKYLITAEFDEGIDIKKAWEDKTKELTASQGWEAIGEFIQSATDNAKVLNLGPIGANNHTNSIFAFALISGFSIPDIIEFMANSKIKAISAIYDNFSKQIPAPIDLQIFFGNSKDIPLEFKSLFGLTSNNSIIDTKPVLFDNKEFTMKNINLALMKTIKKGTEIYESFNEMLEGEEELRILAGFIGLDSKHPNSLFDSINKFRTIGSNINKVLSRGQHSKTLGWLYEKHKEDIASPAALGYKYSDDPEFRQDIQRLVTENVSYLDGLQVIASNDSFSTYVNNLGYKLNVASKLSYTPEVYLDSKFSGFKAPTYFENIRVERIVHGYSIESYFKSREYPKKVSLLTTDKKYNLNNSEELSEFLSKFKDEVAYIKQNNPGNIFLNLLRLDRDRFSNKDYTGDNQFYNLYIGNNVTADQVSYIRAALKELNNPNKPENRTFYENLKLYSLVVDSGLIRGNNIFRFLDEYMDEYNEHLEKILIEGKAKDLLTSMAKESILLNAPHLIPIKDTSKAVFDSANEDMDSLMHDYMEYQREMEEGDMLDMESSSDFVFGDNELNVNQDTNKGNLYKSSILGRVYYYAGPMTGHIAVSSKNSPSGTLMKYDNSLDPIQNADWQYGIPLNYQGKTIHVLRYSDTDSSYYYIENQEDIKDPNKISRENIKKLTDKELLINNPDWVFRGNNFRKQTSKETFNRDFKAIKNEFSLPDRSNGFDIKHIKDIDVVTTNRHYGDTTVLRKANKALIKSMDDSGIRRYQSVMDMNRVNKDSYSEEDTVAVLVEGNLPPEYKRLDKIISSGAMIVTPSQDSISATPLKTIGSSTSKGDNLVRTYLRDKGYTTIKVEPDKKSENKSIQYSLWAKKSTTNVKESRILLPNDYKVQSKKATHKVLNSLILSMANLFPNVDVELLYANEIEIELGKEYSKSKGFVKNGTVYFNLDLMTLDTPIHEFGHIFIEDTKKNNPELYQVIMDEAINHEIATTVKKTYPELEGNDLAEEIFVTALGLSGQEQVSKSKLQKYLNAFVTWWKNALARVFKSANINSKEISLNDSINTIIDKLGKKMVFGSDVMSNLTTEDIQYAELSRRDTMSYAMIENNLIEQGFIKKICTF